MGFTDLFRKSQLRPFPVPQTKMISVGQVRQKGDLFRPWGAAQSSLSDYNLQSHPRSSDRKTINSVPEPRHPGNRIHSEQLRPTEFVEDVVETWEPFFPYHTCATWGFQHPSRWSQFAPVKFLYAVYMLSSYQHHLLLGYCWVCNGAMGTLDSRLFLTESFNFCVFRLPRSGKRCVHFLTEFGKHMCFSNVARDFWRGGVLSFLAGVKEGGLSHRWCSRASVFSFRMVVAFSAFPHLRHSVHGLCTPFHDLLVQRKMICCGCIQCLVWSLLSANVLDLGLQHESSDMFSIKMWLTQFLAQLNFYN